MGGVLLHDEKGVNPRITTCRGCGKDVGLILLGRKEGIYKCTNCNAVWIGGRSMRDKKCCSNPHTSFERKIGENEKLPIGLCDDCAKAQSDADAAVAAGGIYWKCSKCHSEGAIRLHEGTEGIIKDVRERLEVPEGPCGLEFDGEPNCPICSGDVPSPE